MTVHSPAVPNPMTNQLYDEYVIELEPGEVNRLCELSTRLGIPVELVPEILIGEYLASESSSDEYPYFEEGSGKRESASQLLIRSANRNK